MIKMVDYQKIKGKFEPMKVYTYLEALNKICKGQSSTASYILQDMILAGYFQELKDRRLRINI